MNLSVLSSDPDLKDKASVEGFANTSSTQLSGKQASPPAHSFLGSVALAIPRAGNELHPLALTLSKNMTDFLSYREMLSSSS